MLKFIVMSDLHLVPEGEVSHSIDTFERFEMARDHIMEGHSDAQFCVFNGDLADHGDVDAYRRLKDGLRYFGPDCYFTLGNHDDAAGFRKVFGNEAAFDHVIEAGSQRVIVLDSQDPGKVSGILSEDQLAWAEHEIGAASGHPLVVVLHHPICDLGIGTDFIRLQNPDRLIAALRAHGNVRHVISGHVHVNTSGTIAGVPFSTMNGNHYAFSPFSSSDIS